MTLKYQNVINFFWNILTLDFDHIKYLYIDEYDNATHISVEVRESLNSLNSKSIKLSWRYRENSPETISISVGRLSAVGIEFTDEDKDNLKELIESLKIKIAELTQDTLL